jgi:type VI protein secretion system component Hcp
MKFTYKAIPEVALQFYRENGMQVTFDESLFNGLLVIEAPSEEVADQIRMTYTDIRMWERVTDE